MIDQLKSLAVFAKTVELGSFRKAALALSLSPSVISHHVSMLERSLGLPLLYRSTRRLALTPDGEALYDAVREMLEAAERGLDAVSGRSESPSGLLRITAPAFLAETKFCRALAAFSKEHPKVKLSIAFTDARRDLLRDGLDVAIRVGTLEDSTNKSRKLADMRRVLVGSSRYMRDRAMPRTLRELDAWDFVRLSPRAAEITMTPPGRKKPVTLGFAPRISVDSAAAIREMVLAGAGLAVLPDLLVRSDLARGSLVEVLPGWRIPLVGVHAVWPGNAQRPGLTLRFVEFMASQLKGLFAPPSA